MISPRLSACLALAASALVATAALAGERGGVVVSRPGLPLDPELLPPNTAPGDCVTRRVTGPGGAYRWDRVECETDRDGAGYDRWAYAREPLRVETRHLDDHYAGDRGESRYEARREDRYGAGGRQWIDYRYAGKDADGYLVWPGKTP